MEKRLDRVYDNLLENDKQRRQTFQRIAGQVYKSRNNAKELLEQGVVQEPLLNELREVVRSLETDIYEFRLILEIEGVFIHIHEFKNEAKAITSLFRDLIYCQANPGVAQGDAELISEIQASYAELDQHYLLIIDRLTAQSRASELV